MNEPPQTSKRIVSKPEDLTGMLAVACLVALFIFLLCRWGKCAWQHVKALMHTDDHISDAEKQNMRKQVDELIASIVEGKRKPFFTERERVRLNEMMCIVNAKSPGTYDAAVFQIINKMNQGTADSKDVEAS